MAAVIFRALSNLRFAIETETDADSPDNETTYPAIREAIEMLYKLCFSDGFTSTASINPPNDNTGVLTHAGAAQDVDEHNGRTLVITSGLARGDFFTIDDTAAQTIICTGDNLFSAGVRSGDDFEIFYDIKNNSDGHDHDDVNSKPVQGVAVGSISRDEIEDYAASSDYAEIIDTGEDSGDRTGTPAKIAEIMVPRGGTIRTTFTMKEDTSGNEAYGRIYKNGGAVGTTRTSTTSYVQHTEDLVFAKDDLLQLYVWDNGTITSYFKDFGYYVDNTLSTAQIKDAL